MTQAGDDSTTTLLIGPGFEPAAVEPEVPESAECGDGAEGRRLLVRLVIAFIAIVGIAVLCFGVLPAAGVYLHPLVPLAAFGAIAVAVLLNASSEGQFESKARTEDESCGCDGRPVGCCPGPRPPRFLSEPPRRG